MLPTVAGDLWVLQVATSLPHIVRGHGSLRGEDCLTCKDVPPPGATTAGPTGFHCPYVLQLATKMTSTFLLLKSLLPLPSPLS